VATGNAGTLPFIPNGNTDVITGNYRRAFLSPLTGQSINLQNNLCAGRIKRIWVNVLRAYTGTQFSANTLFLHFYEYGPVFNGTVQKVNLSIPGIRIITATNTYGAQTNDILSILLQDRL
jgi:hypothetical protein